MGLDFFLCDEESMVTGDGLLCHLALSKDGSYSWFMSLIFRIAGRNVAFVEGVGMFMSITVGASVGQRSAARSSPLAMSTN